MALAAAEHGGAVIFTSDLESIAAYLVVNPPECTFTV